MCTFACCAWFVCYFPPASLAVVAHARSTPMHGAHNSWSDTVRNPRCTGGLLLVCKSTSYNLEVGCQGPKGRKRVKEGGFRSDRRFASCLRGGGRGKFRPAGGVRGQVAGSLPGRQPGTGARQVRGGAVTPSLHRRFLTPDSRHLDVGWASGSPWAGRMCVKPHGRGFGC